jgi:hypothetical protein
MDFNRWIQVTRPQQSLEGGLQHQPKKDSRDPELTPSTLTHSDCTGSSPGCTETITNDTQVCYSTSNALSFYEVPAIAISALTFGGFGSVSTVTVTNETCASESVAKSCTWDDTYAVCHEICVRTEILRVNGYIRLRCNGGTTADNQTNPVDATICMQDFSIDAPVQDSFGSSCGGSCALEDPCSGLDVTEMFPPVENFTSCQTVGSPRFTMLNDTGSGPAPIGGASRLLARSGYMPYPMLIGLIVVLASLLIDT